MKRQPTPSRTTEEPTSRPAARIFRFEAPMDSEGPIDEALLEAMMHANQPYIIAAMERKIDPDRIIHAIERQFVGLAEAEAIDSGQPAPGKSAIAARTGFTRQRVDRIQSAHNTGRAESKQRAPHAMRVLQAWRTDTDFLNDDDTAKVLPLRGPISFDSLVKRYSPSVRPKAILRELERIKAVRVTKDRRVEMLNHPEIDTARTAQSIKDSGQYLCELGRTLLDKAANRDLPPFHRRVVGVVKTNEVAALIRDHSTAGSVLLSTFQQAMAHPANAAIPGSTPGKAVELAVHFFISESEVVMPALARKPMDGKESSHKKRSKSKRI